MTEGAVGEGTEAVPQPCGKLSGGQRLQWILGLSVPSTSVNCYYGRTTHCGETASNKEHKAPVFSFSTF